MANPSPCIVGCGYVGRRLLQKWTGVQSSLDGAQQGGSIRAVVRRSSSAQQLRQAGVQVLELDLDSTTVGGATRSPDFPVTGGLFYLVPPPAEGESDLRLDRFLRLSYWRGDWQPEVFVYLSTTGVYGDCKGAVVDESTPVNPMSPRARRRVSAEEMTRIWCHERQIRRVVLRVPGIYGPDRLPLARLRAGEPLIRRSEAGFGNRIHVDDLVEACFAAATNREARGIYNVSDGNPCNVTDYFQRLAELSGLPCPAQIPLDEARLTFSPARLSFLEESRRVSNRRMQQDLGVRLKYANFEDGIRASLEG